MAERVFSRRKFIVGATGLVTAVALASSFPIETVESEEGLVPLSHTVALDFASTYSSPGKIRYGYLSTLDRVKQLLGPDEYVPLLRLVREFGPRVFTVEKFKKEVMSRYPEYGLVAGGMLSFASHGAQVMACHERFAKSLGYDPAPVVVPVQDGLEILELHHRDNLDNPAVLMRLSIDPLMRKLHDFPNRSIVNMSLQIGTFAVIHKRRNVHTAYHDSYARLQEERLTYYLEVNPEDGRTQYHFYNPALYALEEQGDHRQVISKATGEAVTVGADGYVLIPEDEVEQFTIRRRSEILRETLQIHELDISPYYEIRGAYTGEYGVENIQELFRLVYAFPEKLFVVAAGNYGDDLRPLRAQFAQTWPENLLIVGYWDSAKQYPQMYNTYDIFGADLYYDGTPYGLRTGSSMATAVISAAASILWQNGYHIQQIKAILRSAADEVTIDAKPYIPIGSTNIEDYIHAELHQASELVHVFSEVKFKESIARKFV
jgi:hypothetical protein